MKRLFIILLLYSSNISANDCAFYTAQSLLIADWLQTRTIVKTPPEINNGITYYTHELNPVLGSNPSLTAVGFYFTTALVGNAVMYHYWPNKSAQWMLIGLQANSVGNNLRLGIKFDF